MSARSSFAIVMSLMMSTACTAPDSRQDRECETVLGSFETQYSIAEWPLLHGCAYGIARPQVVGLLVQLEPPDQASPQDDGECHLPVHFQVTGLPAGTHAGWYVVAAQISAPEMGDPERLHILGILGNVPLNPALLPPFGMQMPSSREALRHALCGGKMDGQNHSSNSLFRRPERAV